MTSGNFMPEFLRYTVEGLRVAPKESMLLTMKMHN